MEREKTEALLNRELAPMKQEYEKLVKICPIDRLSAEFLGQLDAQRRNVVERYVVFIAKHGDSVEEELQRVVTQSQFPIQALSPTARQFYEEHYRPNAQKFADLAAEIYKRWLDEGDIGPSPSQGRVEYERKDQVQDKTPAPRAADVHDVFFQAVDMLTIGWKLEEAWENDFVPCDSEEESVQKAIRILRAHYFQPDNWLDNTEWLRPVWGPSRSKNIPAHITYRLVEIYRSFVFGNWMAVLALCRCALEYALIDRGSGLGYDPYSDRNGQREAKKLYHLIDLACEKKPNLRADMDTIREHGNRIIHPKKDDKGIVIYPRVTQQVALEAIEATRKVLSELYARSSPSL